MNQFDRIIAIFRPRRTDDLKPELRPMIGSVLWFQASWIIEEGPYTGDWAMTPLARYGDFPCGWVPLCDLDPCASTGKPVS